MVERAVPPKAVIFAPAALSLTQEETHFFREADPFGFILFRRNCETPAQVRSLVAALKNAVGRDNVPFLIDQEGGRVQRLREPEFREMPAPGVLDAIYRQSPEKGLRAAWLHAHLIGRQLADLGITVDCAPCLDLFFDGASTVIGDRSLGRDPHQVAALGNAACRGFRDAGVMPVIKHLPGHGRARVDSHHDLPVIDMPLSELRQTDFLPFALSSEPAWGMTAHLVLTDIDPDRPVTLSERAITTVIREGIGFGHPLMSDDLSMNALSGSLADRASGAIAAGCDIALHCNGDMDEMQAIAEAVGPLDRAALERLHRCPLPAGPGSQEDSEALKAEFDAMLI